MPDPTPSSSLIPSNQTLPSIDPRIGLMLTLADLLVPLFKTGSIDTALAHQMAVSAIEAYHPQTRADFVNIARTIAFSMTALALLGATASPDMTMAEQMRACGRANALNRSADQSERTMLHRRRCQQASSHAGQPAPVPEPPLTDTQIAEAEIQAEIASIMQQYLATRPATAVTPASATAPTPRPATPLATQAGKPLQPSAVAAIRYSVPGSEASHPRTGSYRELLLQHSMIQRGLGQASARQSS
jgi:hypothetical protein